MINSKIFKSYDIRGIYPGEINQEVAFKIGQAFCEYLKPKNVVVGRDTRLSSTPLFKALTGGIKNQGVDVFDIGLCTTPMLNFAVAKYDFDAGIMISASHNPPQYNAFKLIQKGPLQIHEDSGLKTIARLVKLDNIPKASKKGQIKPQDILKDYLEHIMGFTEEIEGLKVVVDYSNGMGSISGQPFFSQLKIETQSLYDQPDGKFPNHLPNPHDWENFQDLQREVGDKKADLGIFFDGDADRAIFVDEKSQIVPPDFLLALLAQEELKRHPGEKVYYDLRFSQVVEEVITKAGGIPFMMRVGNPFYKEKLVKEGGILAGEFSGHIMFAENFAIDDGLFAAVKVLNILSLSRKPLSKLIEQFRKYFQTEEINLKVKDPQRLLELIRDRYQNGELIEIDGILVRYKDWWFSLRQSQTEPLVRLRIEAKTKDLVCKKRKEIIELINSIPQFRYK